MEAGGNVITYLEKFTEILNATKRSQKERRIAVKLQKIQDAGKSCLGWMVRLGWIFCLLFYVI